LVRFLSKKVTKPIFFVKKETGSNRSILVHFGFLTKTNSNRFDSVLTRFFPVWLVFFWFLFGSVRFFWFQTYKTELVGFFKILISLVGFFYSSIFLNFFYSFLDLISFSVFFLTSNLKHPLLINHVIYITCNIK